MMRKISIALAITLFAFISVAQTPQKEKPGHLCDQCAFVQQALKDVAKTKAGDKRAALLKDFEMSGGMNFPLQTRYIYKKCHSIQLDVEFDSNHTNQEYAKTHTDFSPDDVITKVSKLYIDSDHMD
jgi:hypothetical protein